MSTVAAVNAAGTNLNDNKDIQVDGVLPEIDNAFFLDTDFDGTIDEIVIEVSETISESTLSGNNIQNDFIIGGLQNGIPSGTNYFAFETSTAASNTIDGTGDQYFTISVNIVGTATTSIVYEDGSLSLEDLIGNFAATGSDIAPAVITDQARPVIIESVTLDAYDEGAMAAGTDGDVERFEVQFSEPIASAEFSETGALDDFVLSAPSASFGTTQAMTGFSESVTDAGGLGDFTDVSTDTNGDEFYAFTFTPSTISGTGIFTLTYTEGTNGNEVQDAAGNILYVPSASSTPTGTTTLRDYAIPLVKDLSTDLTPADGDNAVGAINQISVQYSEQVFLNGSNTITFVRNTAPPGSVEYNATTNNGLVDDGQASGLMTFDLNGTLEPGTPYYVVMDAGSFADAALNVSPDQFPTDLDWNFNTEQAVNVSSTSFTGSSSITLTFNDDITLSDEDVNDFTVRDVFNGGNTFGVTTLL